MEGDEIHDRNTFQYVCHWASLGVGARRRTGAN